MEFIFAASILNIASFKVSERFSAAPTQLTAQSAALHRARMERAMPPFSPHGKYRLRTWLRGNLPAALSRFLPKGSSDCGNHEWYNSNDQVDHCYHCEVGVRPRTHPIV